MKSFLGTAALASTLLLLSACNESPQNSGGVKFNAQERESKFASDAEREAAIAKKKNELNINAETMLYGHDVKLSVIPPALQGDITQDVAEGIAMRMLEMTCANGIGGLNNAPIFALASSIEQTGREATGTAPQKMIVKYTMSYRVVNMQTGDAYATASQEIVGVGRSFEEAALNAAQDIKNTPAIQQMLADASVKIIAWYNDNLQSFKNQVEKAESLQDYALALAFVETVPEKATAAFEYATKKQASLLPKFMHKVATTELAEMQTAITAANGQISSDVAAHMALIPADAPEYKQAQALYAKYEGQIAARQTAEAVAQQVAEQRAHEQKLAQMKADVRKAKYEARAVSNSQKQMDYYRDGFWGSLGKRIIGGIDYVGDTVSDAVDEVTY